MQRHRSSRDTSQDDSYLLRLPGPLKTYLTNLASEHGLSLNEEIVRRLSRPVYRQGMTLEQWDRMMRLAPTPNDPRTNAEIAAQMERYNPGSFTEHETGPLAKIEDIELLAGSLPF
jgi:hypothetical protein